MKTVDEALGLILAQAKDFGPEVVRLDDSRGRVLYAPVSADRDYPPFDRCAMDGYAVRQQDIIPGASLEIVYDLRAGDFFGGELLPGQCIRIMTGAPVPEGTDRVIRSEQAVAEGGRVRFNTPGRTPGRHISSRGEDAVSGTTVLQKGERITPAVQGVLAMVGCSRPLVACLPRVRVYSTGSEIRPLAAGLPAQHIRDMNGYALRSLFAGYGIRVRRSDPLPDEQRLLKKAFRKGLASDILVISGGVSQGASDFVPEVLVSLGVRLLFHGVQIKPGRPLWVGVAEEGALVFALPGNPVSAQVGFKVFIEPYLRNCLGLPLLQALRCPMGTARKTGAAFDEYFPAILRNGPQRSEVVPVPSHGSGDGLALAHAEGLAVHPGGQACLQPGDAVEYFPWEPS